MNALLPPLIKEHRAIEAGLESLAVSMRAGQVDETVFRSVAALTAQHYAHEELFLERLERKLAEKLRRQHEEGLEVAAVLEESLSAGDQTGVMYLARRFVAITQHNIIEEERDVFPLYDHGVAEQ